MVDSTDMQTGRYKAYPEYKDSRVQWLSDIPSGWKASKLKRVCSVKGGYAFRSELFSNRGIPVIRIGDIQRDGSIDLSGCKYIPIVSPLVHKEYSVTNGQILMAMTGATIGKAGRYSNSEPALINQRVGKFELNNQNMLYSFLWYILQTDSYQNYIKLTAFGGAQPNISDVEMVDLHVTIPTKEEQESIASFLDYETAKIDTLIEKQQRLIKLLTEKRQAVISHAVTKGLNPDVSMKDSGVEWVDTIPKHWELSKLGYIASIGNGATPSRDNMSFWENGSVGWLNSSKINDVIITEANQFITHLAKIKTSVKSIRENDLLIAITGEGQTRGRVAISKLDATINQHLASIRINVNKLNYEYLYFWLDSNYERIRFESTGAGSTKGAITCSDIASYPVVIPPINEQNEIVEYIKNRNILFDRLSNIANQQIELMQERRTALISAAVTGKIDVRDWVKPE